jgi:hypothetical protein
MKTLHGFVMREAASTGQLKAKPSPSQKRMLKEASFHAIRKPNQGAWRRSGGEVDRVNVFNSRSIDAALSHGWLYERDIGGFLATDLGMWLATSK